MRMSLLALVLGGLLVIGDVKRGDIGSTASAVRANMPPASE